MRIRALALLALFVLLGATLASAAKINAQHDPSVDFSKIKTYRFKAGTGMPLNESLDRRLRSEIRIQLAKKGLTEITSEDQPVDALVTFAAGSIDGLVPGFVAYQTGYYGSLWLVPGGVSHIAGGLIIEMGNPTTDKGMWAASYIMTGTTPQAIQVMAKRAEKAVRGALGKYPPR